MDENKPVMPPPPPRPQPAPKPKREFSALEMFFAWLCLLFGYLFCRVFPVASLPLGGLVFIVLLYVLTLFVLKKHGAKLTGLCLFFCLTAVVFQASQILCANRVIHIFVYLYALLVYFYLLYSAFGNSIEAGFSSFLPFDFLKAVLVMPFESFVSLFPALKASTSKKGGKTLLRVLLGVVLALIPTAVVIGLLSYDQSFTRLLERIFRFDLVELMAHIVSFLLGIPVAMFLFGAFLSSVDKKLADSMSRDKCRAAFERCRIVPLATVCIAVVPVLIVYIIFFISQWDYYVSGFSGVLPASLSYAEYARSGFFELCSVSVINLFLIVGVTLFMKRGGKAGSTVYRLLAILYAFATLVLIATAIAKMAMYIDYYGLTPRRVYATWGMIVLAVIFVLLLVKQFAKRFKLIPTAFVLVVVLFGALALSGVDGFIAKYNVDRYLDGSLPTVDIPAMQELGDAGVEQLVRLAGELDAKNGTDIAELTPEELDADEMYSKLAVALHYIRFPDTDVFSFTFPLQRAKAALESLELPAWGNLERNLIPDALMIYTY